MSNKQTAVEWLIEKLTNKQNGVFDGLPILSVDEIFEQAKEMEQEQAQLYATFVLMCVNNNLPPITFNDWVGNIRR
jgi:hypothetical protein